MVKNTQGQYIPYATWKAQENQRLAALAASARVPQSNRDDFDFSYKAPTSYRLSYDFSQ
jgi:hypothetical protein